MPETAWTASTIFILPEPPSTASVKSALEEHGFCDSLLVDLLGAFSGLWEDFAPSSGHFFEVAEGCRVLGDGDLESDAEFERAIAGYAEWRGALHLYYDRSGDVVLLHPNGSIGWWIGAECRIADYANSLAEFCDRYISFRKHAWKRLGNSGKLLAWPYDYYASNEFPA